MKADGSKGKRERRTDAPMSRALDWILGYLMAAYLLAATEAGTVFALHFMQLQPLDLKLVRLKLWAMAPLVTFTRISEAVTEIMAPEYSTSIRGNLFQIARILLLWILTSRLIYTRRRRV